MIETRIPKEISEYSEKIIFGLSLRQLCVVAVGIPTIILTYWSVRESFNDEIASYIVMFESLPIFAFGFIKIENMYFEKYFILFLKHQFGKNKRYYSTKNEMEVIRNVRNSKKEKNECTISLEYRKFSRKFIYSRRKEFKKKVKIAKQEIRKAKKFEKEFNDREISINCTKVD